MVSYDTQHKPCCSLEKTRIFVSNAFKLPTICSLNSQSSSLQASHPSPTLSSSTEIKYLTQFELKISNCAKLLQLLKTLKLSYAHFNYCSPDDPKWICPRTRFKRPRKMISTVCGKSIMNLKLLMIYILYFTYLKISGLRLFFFLR